MAKFPSILVRCFVGLTLCVSVSLPVFAKQPMTTGQKVLLQAAMQRHIEARLVDGAYLQVNFDTGAVRRLHPVAAHPMIIQMGKYFVLCSDFRDDQGRAVNVDFYMAPRGNTHIVFQTIVDDRKPLMRLMKAGKASPAG